jgi:REP element-mobilizing transposase RayT
MNQDRPNRQSIRLPGYDYAQPGAYFVTVRTHKYTLLFGQVVNGEMELNVYGRVAATYWTRIPRYFSRVKLDAFVVMPNHVHGIIVIVDDNPQQDTGDAFRAPGHEENPISEHEPGRVELSGFGNASPLHLGSAGPAPGSLGAIVGNYKSIVTRRINRIRRTPGADVWQRNYYEHVIRATDDVDRIREYIANNPARWAEDRHYRPGSWVRP